MTDRPRLPLAEELRRREATIAALEAEAAAEAEEDRVVRRRDVPEPPPKEAPR